MCEALDRGEEARNAVKSDGTYLRDRFGQLKPHPALAVERDARVAVARLARELNLEPPAPEARPPRRTT
jgi:phage terminase small subunit